MTNNYTIIIGEPFMKVGEPFMKLNIELSHGSYVLDFFSGNLSLFVHGYWSYHL